MKTALRATALAALLAAGCGSRAELEREPIALDATFSDGSSVRDAAPFWSAFASDELDALVLHALAANPDIEAATARVAQSAQLATEARARFWPTVDASLGYARQRVNLSPPLGTQTTGTWTASLAASYEVDAAGRVRHAARAARLDVDALRDDVDAVRISVAAEVVDAWVEVGYQRARRSILDEQLALSEAQGQLTAQRFAFGLATAADALLQDSQAQTFRTLLPQTEGGEAAALNRLAFVMGELPGRVRVATGERLPLLAVPPQTGVPADLLQARPDVRAAWARAQAADARVAAAIAERLPTIRLTGALGFTSQDLGELLDGFVWNAALSVVQPLVDGGRRRAAQRRAEAVLDERLVAYRRAILAAMREVEDALARERAAHDVVASLDEELRLAIETLAATERQYLLGGAEYPRVVSARATVARLELSRLDAERAVLSHRLSLWRALGGALPEPTTVASAP